MPQTWLFNNNYVCKNNNVQSTRISWLSNLHYEKQYDIDATTSYWYQDPMLHQKKNKKKQDMTVPFARARAKLGGSIR